MLENYFLKYRKNVLGVDETIDTPYHKNIRVVYADWTASGRNYKIIEERLQHDIMPLVANTHTETNSTGQAMTQAYHKAREIIKHHVNANEQDVLISNYSGMTGVANKFQRILGFKIHEKFKSQVNIPEEDKPIVFVSHMEHHSNQTSWLETIADVEIIPPCEKGLVNCDNLKELLIKYQNRKTKIAAITSCSNVTGIVTPYHEVAKIMHQHGGLCFVDFACSAPYIDINMHPDNADAYLDAIYFSPHKFLGGPGSSGVLVFNSKLYKNLVPDNPGGGTVEFTNPWGSHKYIENIEAREDGGTPAFLQTIKVAMSIQLKEEMGVDNILNREHELLSIIWKYFDQIPNLHVLAADHKDRLGVISFFIEGLHYNVGVKMLNDKFGIQTRGGCSCAGTYGHYLLKLVPETSNTILNEINQGIFSSRPGWIRMSIHPTMTNEEITYICESIADLAKNFKEWEKDYDLENKHSSVTFNNKEADSFIENKIESFYHKNYH